MPKNMSNCDQKLDNAFWTFRIAFKVVTSLISFILVYNLDAIVPMEMVVPSLRVAAVHRSSLKQSLSDRLTELKHLEEDKIHVGISPICDDLHKLV